MSAPRFSVVVPAHDEADTLPATLASLAAQRCPVPYEVIVVDNASTDATAALARAAGARVVSEPELGVCRARQAGVEVARGAIVVSTDADTTHPVDWLARIDATFRAHAERGVRVVAVAGPCRYVDAPWWATTFPPLWFAAIGGLARCGGGIRYLTATNVAFRRADFPGYDVSLHQGGDEMGLLRTLQSLGPVVWDGGLVVETSSRRMQAGLPYTVLVSYGYYYLGQGLRRRLAGGAPVVAAPAVRAGDASTYARRRRRGRAVSLTLLAGVLTLRVWRSARASGDRR